MPRTTVATMAPGRGSARRALQFVLLVLLPALLLAPAACADPLPGADPRSLLLIAAQGLTDPNFSRSVVLVTQHGGGGPVGVILNRPTKLALSEVFDAEPALRGGEDHLFLGGPVARHTLVFVMRSRETPASAIELLPGLFMSLEADEPLRRLRAGGKASGVKVFAGYADWAPGQLEKEIAGGQWHLLPAEAAAVFDSKPEDLWMRLLARASLKQVRSGPAHGAAAVTRMARKSLTLVSVGPLTSESPSAEKKQ